MDSIMFAFGFACFALGLLVGAFGLVAVSLCDASKKRDKAHERAVNTVNEVKTEWNIDVPGVG